jgi:sulfoxide reductase catalytic subunit YedY
MSRRHESWELSESAVTDEAVYLSRRRFVKALGLGTLSAAGLVWTGRQIARAQEPGLLELPELKAARHPEHSDLGRPLTDKLKALRYNNFYEFSTDKAEVWKLARDYRVDPYTLTVDGLVERPGTLSLEQVEALGLEERVYRFRCVEAWSMVVPWTGVPLRTLLEHVGVKPEARYLRFETHFDPELPGVKSSRWYRFPYYEALRLDEASHDLTLLATGVYGRRLPMQSGAPLRVIVPWKYGYKGAKSVVKITLTADRPPTFWNDQQPDEYSWLSNVEPDVPHPRWSQATERIVDTGERIPTLPYNGYAEQVAGLYLP